MPHRRRIPKWFILAVPEGRGGLHVPSAKGGKHETDPSLPRTLAHRSRQAPPAPSSKYPACYQCLPPKTHLRIIWLESGNL
jgi:hypothetical protein